MKSYIKITELEDVVVKFELFAQVDSLKFEVVKTLICEVEICDTDFEFNDEYRAYLPNTGAMLYIVFDEEAKTHEDRILRDMCLAMYARKVDQNMYIES